MWTDLRKRISTSLGSASRRLVLLVVASLVTATSVIAAESVSFRNSAVDARLITAENGINPDATSISAGLHLQLGEDWKTYWRSPGEVGLPPSIEWVGSTNIEVAEFLWPAPERFTAFGIENFGYHKEVVFPIRVVLLQPGMPVELRARVNLLVCSTVCVPQEFDLAGCRLTEAGMLRIARGQQHAQRRPQLLRLLGQIAPCQAARHDHVAEQQIEFPIALQPLEGIDAVSRLPYKQRAVLVLAKFEGLSYRQIAETLQITEGAVESRLFRAMRNLSRAQESTPPGVSQREAQ